VFELVVTVVADAVTTDSSEAVSTTATGEVSDVRPAS
jgi:hypothetical protein